MNGRRERLFRAPGFRWNPDRDHFLMEVVGKGGVVRQEFIEHLVFGHSVKPKDLADDRLAKMKKAKLVRRVDVVRGERPHWTLTESGVVLARSLEVPGADEFAASGRGTVRDAGHLDHINAFRFALAREGAKEGHALSCFWPEALLRRRLGRPTALLKLVPDALGVLGIDGREVPFALEVDLGTERARVVVAKGASYMNALRAGGVFGLAVEVVVFWLPAGRRLRSVAEGLARLHRPGLFIVGELPVDVTRLELPPFGLAEDAARGGRPSTLLFDLARTSPRTSPAAREVREAESLVPQEKTGMGDPRELRSWSRR